MSFLSAPLLAGLLLAAVPIIIHILNRRRFQVIDWPPMKYLKLTMKKNRRRVRIEQMLLLAMRTLAVILLILAVARPVLSRGSLAKFLPGKGRTTRVIVIDDSLSMGYSVAGRTAFQVAQNAAEDLIKAAGTQDSLSLLVTSAPEHPLIRDGNLQEAAKFADLVATLPQTDTANNWAATFTGISHALTTASYSTREVVLITDLRQSGWSEEVTAAADKLAEASVPVRIIDVGDRRTDNLSLLKFEMTDAVALPGQAIHLRGLVRNDTGGRIAGLQATLNVEGQPRPVLLPDLAVGATAEIPLTVSLDNPGNYALSLSVGKDALPADDTRYLTLTVRPTVSVLLVDGQPSAQPFESETDFLALAYSIGARPWSVQHVSEFDPHRFRPGSPEIPDVMVLANVPMLTTEQIDTIERLVKNGMGLMIFTGDLVDADLYNQRLYKDGKGVLPVKLARSVDTPVSGIVIEKDPQSPLAPLAKLLPAALQQVRTRRYTAVDLPTPAPEGVTILARWNNSENPPAVLQKTFGAGRVLLFTTTAGKRWTDWPLDPTYVLAVRSAALSVARSPDTGSTLAAGDPIRLTLLPGQAAIGPQILPPLPAGATPDSVDIEKNPAGTVLTYGKTYRAGIYNLTWKDEKTKPMSQRFAVNPADAESDLDPISESQLSSLLGNLKAGVQRYDTSGAGLGEPPRELWRPLAAILLCLMAGEAAFAVFVGRDR